VSKAIGRLRLAGTTRGGLGTARAYCRGLSSYALSSRSHQLAGGHYVRETNAMKRIDQQSITDRRGVIAARISRRSPRSVSNGQGAGGLGYAFALCNQKGTVQRAFWTITPFQTLAQASSWQKPPMLTSDRSPVSRSINSECGQFEFTTCAAKTLSSPAVSSQSLFSTLSVQSSRSKTTFRRHVSPGAVATHTSRTGAALAKDENEKSNAKTQCLNTRIISPVFVRNVA
jgi:hypothetical protein